LSAMVEDERKDGHLTRRSTVDIALSTLKTLVTQEGVDRYLATNPRIKSEVKCLDMSRLVGSDLWKGVLEDSWKQRVLVVESIAPEDYDRLLSEGEGRYLLRSSATGAASTIAVLAESYVDLGEDLTGVFDGKRASEVEKLRQVALFAGSFFQWVAFQTDL